MMNSENPPKEIVQSFIDLVNMVKWLMVENQQPSNSLTQELGRLFPSIRGGGSKVKAVRFLGLVLVHHLLQQLIQIILVSQHGLTQDGRLKKSSKARSKKPRKSMSRKTTSGKTPRKFAILSRDRSK